MYNPLYVPVEGLEENPLGLLNLTLISVVHAMPVLISPIGFATPLSINDTARESGKEICSI